MMHSNKPHRSYCSARRAAAVEETRARVVAAARVLLSGGKDKPGFSLESVARQAGVSRLTVYNQFTSKQGLLEAVFDDMAKQGGLSELPAAMAEQDPALALHRYVALFCRFWTTYNAMLPKFSAVMKLDEEMSASLRARQEHCRHDLAILIAPLMNGGKQGPPAPSALIDVVFALTRFEMFSTLLVQGRSAEDVEALIQDLVWQTIERFRLCSPALPP